MTTVRIEKVTGDLPQQLTPNTLYFVKQSSSQLVNIYVSNSDGTDAQHVITREEILSEFITVSDIEPPLPHDTQLWWSSASGVLYVQYDDGSSINWVEAISSVAIPEFAGTGSANTMARSDHYHTSIVLEVADW